MTTVSSYTPASPNTIDPTSLARLEASPSCDGAVILAIPLTQAADNNFSRNFKHILCHVFATSCFVIIMAPLSLRSILAYAGSFFSQTPLTIESAPSVTSTVPYVPLSGAPTCPIDGPISCHNKTAVGDSCCYISPGGRFLLTQFWDQEVRGNNLDSWTLHGLVRLCPISLLLRVNRP